MRFTEGFTGTIADADPLSDDVLARKDPFLTVLKENIAAVVNEDRDKATKDIDEKLEEYDEQLVRRFIKKVTVFEEKFTVEFKSGVEADVEV